MPTLPSFFHVVVLSIALRVALILYSEWHDAHSVVKYTDIDYRVFSDAARFLLHPTSDNYARGRFGFGLGDPYSRETYRYTPLLAVALVPNELLHPSFGKYLFAACDVLNGWLIHNLLLNRVLPRALSNDRRARLATMYSALHLLNPLVFTISTRGSSEAVLSLFVLLTLHTALNGRWDAAAVLMGASTHWKIYPLVYGVACLGAIGGVGNAKGMNDYARALVNAKTVRFAVLSAGTFVFLGLGCYAVWGYPFLYESYLYHVHRLDHRHNFSPYFYLIYLTYGSSTENLSIWNRILRSPLTSFGPQMALTLGSGLLFGRKPDDLVFTWFVQTVVFVVFNKVCTSQYFLWYLLLLPMLLPQLKMTRRRAAGCIVVWVAAQALWLGEAYKLEFLGQDVFHSLWVRGLVYVGGNCWVLTQIMGAMYIAE